MISGRGGWPREKEEAPRGPEEIPERGALQTPVGTRSL